MSCCTPLSDGDSLKHFCNRRVQGKPNGYVILKDNPSDSTKFPRRMNPSYCLLTENLWIANKDLSNVKWELFLIKSCKKENDI